jgi:saccharopine dehydrogenase-like NADP-dependent oxidoreductase
MNKLTNKELELIRYAVKSAMLRCKCTLDQDDHATLITALYKLNLLKEENK